MKSHLERLRSVVLLLLTTAVAAQSPALKGFDPVLLTRGQEVAGKPELTVVAGPFTYRFADEKNRATFRAAPDRYEIQLGGACGRMGPLSGAGDPDRFAVHGERIYVFASEQCRTAFGKRADAFLDPDAPRPEPTAEQRTRGEALLKAAVAAHGGADRIRALRTYRYERSAVKGDMTEKMRMQVAFPGSLRTDHDYLQKDKRWGNGQVTTPDAAFFVTQRKVEEMHATGRREAERRALRDPLLAMWAALAGKPVVVGRGKATVGGTAVEQLGLWIDGCETTFGLGDDGRIRTAAFRGRGPQSWFGEVVQTFGDYTEAAGVVVPTTLRATFEGKPSPDLDERREHLGIDVVLPADTFARPR